jgi:hypothetical protein
VALRARVGGAGPASFRLDRGAKAASVKIRPILIENIKEEQKAGFGPALSE